jgi:hypothetical protein
MSFEHFFCLFKHEQRYSCHVMISLLIGSVVRTRSEIINEKIKNSPCRVALSTSKLQHPFSPLLAANLSRLHCLTFARSTIMQMQTSYADSDLYLHNIRPITARIQSIRFIFHSNVMTRYRYSNFDSISITILN